MLETLLIGPLKLIFEVIFTCAYRFVGNYGLAIICLSLIMNVLVLPLYRRADAMQERARDIEAKLHDGVAHIKKTFSGDERMMILNTYYRQNNYKATSALNGSVSLLLEIPFFIAAYQFLSGADILGGVSFGPIADLGAPDGLLVIGGVTLNLLPILMTLINFVSSALYLKGFPLKTKIQLYGMALFFLFFLYTSPSCLVFYWTLNNLFSLVKNIFYKLKNPQKVLRILLFAAGICLIVFGAVIFDTPYLSRRMILVGLGVLLCVPMVYSWLKPHLRLRKEEVRTPDRKLFLVGSAFLTVFLGILIPSTFIASSPQEFVDISCFYHPVWYVVSTLCLAGGTFLVWMQVFYWLASPKGKVIFERSILALCGVVLVNYMFFGTNLGIISSDLKYETGLYFSLAEQAVNLAVLIVVGETLYFLCDKWRRAAVSVLLVAALAMTGMSGIHMATIQKSVSNLQQSAMQDKNKLNFQLSKTGNNVVVFMLDRAMGEYIPYLFRENPTLEKQFSGFTYYSNTISHGGFTIFGTPPLFGGYEYTPVEMNKRDTEALADKQNEALKMMPVLFSEHGYDVTVCDPPYANYQWAPDLSIFDDRPEINACLGSGQFNDIAGIQASINSRLRNFFCFSVMKSMPLVAQSAIYNEGNYNQAKYKDGTFAEAEIDSSFMAEYSVLTNLPTVTQITSEDVDTCLIIANSLTHEPIILQEPEYVPAVSPDNSDYDAQHADRFTLDGVELKMAGEWELSHYQTNMAALMQLGKWFDYMRENGVYDNTRIIIVSDHGRDLAHIDSLLLDNGHGGVIDTEFFRPLLMFKDFNSEGFTTSDEFMTNADVPTLAVRGLLDNPTNPFTGKPINDDEKYAHEQFVIYSREWGTSDHRGNSFNPAQWLSVSGDADDMSNWTVYDGKHTLKEHVAP